MSVEKATAKALLSNLGGSNPKSQLILANFAKALAAPPFRKGIMGRSTVEGIFTEVDFTNSNAAIKFDLDLLTPGTEKEFTSYVVPNCGYLPERCVENDFVVCPTYMVANRMCWCLKHQRDAGYNMFDRVLEVFRDGFSVKISNDGWHLLLAAGLSRGLIAQDSAATPGYFTKRLVSIMKVSMRRNGGGNSSSFNRSRLTDLYMSPEGVEGMRNWGVDQADDITRREIFLEGDDEGSSVFGVNIRPLDELGVGKEYQTYYTSTLSGTLPPNKQEICVGLDLSREDSFVMPVRHRLEVNPDPTMLVQMKGGVVGWMEFGMIVLDSRRVLLGAL